MQIVTSSLAQAPGQPSVPAKPGRDVAADTFAGLLAALSGVSSLLPQPVLPDTGASQAATGLQAQGSFQLAAGASPDPCGWVVGGPSLAAAPVVPDVPGPALAAVSEDPSVSSGPSSASVPPGDSAGYLPSAAVAGSPPTAGAVAAPAGRWGQSLPAPAVAPDNAVLTLLPGASPPATPVQSSVYPPEVSETAVSGSGAVPSGGNPPEVGAVVSNPTGAQTSVPSTPGAASSQAPPGGYQPAVDAVVPGVVAVPTAQGAPAGPPAASGPVPAATPTAQQAAGSAADTPSGARVAAERVAQGAAATVVEATQAVLAAPVQAHGSLQGPASPGTASGTPAPSPAGLAAQGTGAVSSSQPQLAPDGGSSSSGDGGKGSDPGKTPATNPLGASAVPVFQPASPASGSQPQQAASLPQQAAGSILAHLNQDGRLPARLELQLDPPALGKLTIHLAMEAGTLSVTFFTSSSHARDAVAASLPQMRDLLNQHNFVLGQTGVYVGSQGGGGSNQSGDYRGGPLSRPGIRPAGEATTVEERIQIQAQSGSSLLNILV